MIRISGGRFRSRTIQVPKGQAVRPTTSLVRESIFNRLASVMPGCRFLDGYAGSGLMGFEALSRGAACVMAVEQNRQHYHVIGENAQKLGLDETVFHPVCAPLERVLDSPPEQPFDVVYLDPPYAHSDITPILSRLAEGWLSPETGCVLWERATEKTPVVPPPGWAVKDSRDYGDSQVVWLIGSP